MSCIANQYKQTLFKALMACQSSASQQADNKDFAGNCILHCGNFVPGTIDEFMVQLKSCSYLPICSAKSAISRKKDDRKANNCIHTR